jgi:hypothetical protein
MDLRYPLRNLLLLLLFAAAAAAAAAGGGVAVIPALRRLALISGIPLESSPESTGGEEFIRQ